MNFSELPDEAWDVYVEERQMMRYRAALSAHPHPADPDHPEPEEYGIYEGDTDD